MRKIIDLENDTFQAHCQIDYLQTYIEEGATIRHVRDDVALVCGNYPVCHFNLNGLPHYAQNLSVANISVYNGGLATV